MTKSGIRNREGANLLRVAKIDGIGMLNAFSLCILVLVTKVASAFIEDVPASSMAIASSLHGTLIYYLEPRLIAQKSHAICRSEGTSAPE